MEILYIVQVMLILDHKIPTVCWTADNFYNNIEVFTQTKYLEGQTDTCIIKVAKVAEQNKPI